MLQRLSSSVRVYLCSQVSPPSSIFNLFPYLYLFSFVFFPLAAVAAILRDILIHFSLIASSTSSAHTHSRIYSPFPTEARKREKSFALFFCLFPFCRSPALDLHFKIQKKVDSFCRDWKLIVWRNRSISFLLARKNRRALYFLSFLLSLRL